MIEVLRDQFGIPHCYAESEADAFFAQGWVHAADRLWQMEYDRRRALGRWSEVVGERGLASDRFYRRFDLAASVKRDLDAMSPESRAMLDSYTAGVNAVIGDPSAPKPRELVMATITPEPWTPWHCLLVYRVRHVLMGSARSKLWRALVAEVLGADVARTMVAGWGEDHVACVPPGAPCPDGQASGLGDLSAGSNNWAVSGSRTASGLPLVAGDPHRELEAPNVYVQGHVSCPEWDVLGIGLPGVPGFSHFGHNQRVAWCITHAMADDQDLYRYSGTAPGRRRVETIEVRDGAPVEVEVVSTPRGPLISDDLALCWTGTVETNLGFETIQPMLRATNIAELFEATRRWVEPVQSLVVADVDGAIGYLTRGRVPRRRRSEPAWLPVEAEDESFGWDGWVPFDELPRIVDPEGGFVFSANNHISADPAAPYIGLDCSAPFRASRIVATLSGLTGATIDDMAALHRDTLSVAGQRWAARLVDWPPLAGWDGDMSADSTAAAAYSVLRVRLLELALQRSGLAAVLGESRYRVLPGVVPESAVWRVVDQHLTADDRTLLGGWSWEQALAQAMAAAEATWSGETWGELHATAQRHPLWADDLDPPRVPMGGDMDTVQAATYTPTTGLAMKAGSVARYAFDLSDWDRSGWVIPLGAAGEPGADHAWDQQEAWRTGRLLPAPYTRAAVDAAAVTRQEIAR